MYICIMNYSKVFTVKELARQSGIEYQRLIFNLSARRDQVRLTQEERTRVIECIAHAYNSLMEHFELP